MQTESSRTQRNRGQRARHRRCWAIGGRAGPATSRTAAGEVDDDESVRAHPSGAGAGRHLLRPRGRVRRRPQRAGARPARSRAGATRSVIATKFGAAVDEHAGRSPARTAARRTCAGPATASLRRLETDRVDLYQLHVSGLPVRGPGAARHAGGAGRRAADPVVRLEHRPSRPGRRVRRRAAALHRVQHAVSVLRDAPAVLAVCEQYDLAERQPGPAAMGLLDRHVRRRRRSAPTTYGGMAPDWLACVPRRPAGAGVAATGCAAVRRR